MSKERLEEIKQRLVLLHNAADVDDETKNYIFEDLKVEWLIERVQGLEELIDKADKHAVRNGKEIMKLTDEKTRLEIENNRYREIIDKNFNEFWEACVKVVGEDTAYNIISELPEDDENE